MNLHRIKYTSSAILNYGQNEKKDHTTYNNRHVNRSFTTQQNWEINIKNRIVKNKIDTIMTKSRQPAVPFIKSPGKSSVAINQARKNKEILKNNQLMANRIKNVKSTIGK